MLTVNNVHKSYTKGTEIIKGVSFEVRNGMIFGLQWKKRVYRVMEEGRMGVCQNEII